MIKALKKLVIDEIFLNIIKAIYDKPIAKIKLNGEKMKIFPLKSGTKQEGPLSHSSSMKYWDSQPEQQDWRKK
jgi:hypothetical protein